MPPRRRTRSSSRNTKKKASGADETSVDDTSSAAVESADLPAAGLPDVETIEHVDPSNAMETVGAPAADDDDAEQAHVETEENKDQMDVINNKNDEVQKSSVVKPEQIVEDNEGDDDDEEEVLNLGFGLGLDSIGFGAMGDAGEIDDSNTEQNQQQSVGGNSLKGEEEEEDDPVYIAPSINSMRFQMELEFVQLLANPAYLQYLAQNDYFTKPSFKTYLKYLQYWHTQPYSSYILYPYCLETLDMLQSSRWLEALADTRVINWLHREEFHSWKNPLTPMNITE